MMNLPLNIDFTGKVVVITGAAGVICSTMARAFAQAGAKVAALGRTGAKVEKLAQELTEAGYICKAYEVDVLDKEGLEKVHDEVIRDLGPCDILINGAGGNHPSATTDVEFHHQAQEGQKTFFDLEMEGVDYVFNLNFKGTFAPVQVFAKDMVEKKTGCILNVASVASYVALTKISAYAAAKAAISNLTQWLATYFAGTGIRCNAIAPGFIQAEQNKALLWNPDGTPSDRSKKILNGTPRQCFVEPEELLGATFFLCDDKAASAVTGVVIPVDGGFLAYSGV